ncbi:MAG: anaerobic carbon-monoxide dehydrogenase catalytic subunit [Victivallaceae bacterium]|nr:anaerobic carbon-monoxide dehydrogenase catalytic subunit [Victivallaceae bacterium]
MAREKKTPEELVSDAASVEMVKKSIDDCVDTCFSRAETQKTPCKFGTLGVCCKICHMGPCRITPNAPRGICGADADTIVARNFLREVAAGTAAHSDHGRHLVLNFKKVAEGKNKDYQLTDIVALHRIAGKYNIETVDRNDNEIALELAELFISEFTKQEETLETLNLAPENTRKLWKKYDIEPHGIDRMVVEAMHRTHMGVDHDYRNLLDHAFRTSLADGWGGARIASMIGDILFGTPKPVRSTANLGVLEEQHVNIIVHGHEPSLSEMLSAAVKDPEVVEYAKQAGAEGITIAGLCCTANEVLMRRGIPVAGNFLQQELAIITGSVEMMIVDVQCVMPSLPNVASNYHTEVISTADIAKTIGADHVSFDADNAYESSLALIKRAIDNYKNRDPHKVQIPSEKKPLVAGFSVETIRHMLGGRFRASFRPLNDAIISGRIQGVVGIVGCNNIKTKTDSYINTLTSELIKRNIIILKTGCAAQASAKAGKLTPETALEEAGAGLREVCETVGIPPILHMGSCVDNCRILEASSELVWEGGLGDILGGLPAVGVAPEWMSEKAVTIGCYFVASGVDVILGQSFHTSGSENVERYLCEGAQERFGGGFHYIPDPMDAVEKIMELINEARNNLGINKKAERKLMDMKDRRALDV